MEQKILSLPFVRGKARIIFLSRRLRKEKANMEDRLAVLSVIVFCFLSNAVHQP